jgi:ABC-2 type transport system ATP-binding protein
LIRVRELSKTFRVHKKAPGLRGSIRALVRRNYVEKLAVRDISFEVEEGEIVGLIGANGAGKTTLVKMLSGIIHPTSGDAEVMGHRPWERANAFRKRIALIMGQKAQLWWDLPAADCFLLLQQIYEIPEADYRQRLDYLAQVLDVRAELNVQVRRLSLGERMKMELIAALLHAPRVVYLDEPTIGLDLTAQRAIREFILAYREEHQPAMLLTSHYMEDIQRLCKRILILREGQLVYDGSLENVIHTYAPTRRITLHLELGRGTVPRAQDLSEYGEVVTCGEDEICVRVPRGDVARTSASLMQRFPVRDLNIQEDDVGTIIERILRKRTTDESAS